MALAMSLTFFLLLLIGAPIAFGLGITGVLGFLLYDPGLLRLIPQRMFAGVNSYPLMAVPFFVLAGDLMGSSRGSCASPSLLLVTSAAAWPT